jgi:phosphatidylglycerol---prolipoprotein diacylglyceryl transferase
MLSLSHAAVVFPHYFSIFGRWIHPHPLFEALAYFFAFRVYLYLRRRFGDAISTPLRWAAVAFAVAGAAIGSKIVYWLEDPRLTWSHLRDPAYLMGGKTIVGALVFGLIFVEVIKRYVGIKQSTGDLYAIPLALGIAIGRIGCFLTGLSDNTYGVATGLPWGVDFGDGIRRHPTQLYEIVFLLALIPLLYRIMLAISKSTMKEQRTTTVFCSGDAFKFFMVAYLSFRLLCDFIKPYPRIFLGLGGIQWACVICLLYYSRDLIRWLRHAAIEGSQAGPHFVKKSAN